MKMLQPQGVRERKSEIDRVAPIAYGPIVNSSPVAFEGDDHAPNVVKIQAAVDNRTQDIERRVEQLDLAIKRAPGAAGPGHRSLQPRI
ncbi:hypothetical protein ACQP2U_32135 [Nocardia sp. CA-084685]|uniref:hypothetical protein n=1 Tax=Nocardia sp. CA-084685 TaxID=3239970 RepID=UPI003D972C27